MNRLIFNRSLLGHVRISNRRELHFKLPLRSLSRAVVKPVILPVISINRDSRCWLSQTTQRSKKSKNSNDEELADLTKGDAFKFIISGIFGCFLIAYVIAVASQMPVDPDRMTQEKQKKMTLEDLKKYEEEQQAKPWYLMIGDMFPAGWRWVEGWKVVWDNCTPSKWFGLALGWEYYVSSSEPEWKIALPPPLGANYPQVQYHVHGIVVYSKFIY